MIYENKKATPELMLPKRTSYGIDTHYSLTKEEKNPKKSVFIVVNEPNFGVKSLKG